MVGLWAFLGIGLCVCVCVCGGKKGRGGERLLLVVKIKTRGGDSPNRCCFVFCSSVLFWRGVIGWVFGCGRYGMRDTMCVWKGLGLEYYCV